MSGTAQVSGSAHSSLAALDTTVANFLQAQKIPGATVAVSKGGRLIMNKAYGLADVSTSRAMTTATRSRIGSTSKIITALGIMKLTEQEPNFFTSKPVYGANGVLSEPFWANLIYLSPMSDWAWTIRVNHLLSHSSGFSGSGSIPGAAAMFNAAEEDVTYSQVHAHFLWTTDLAFNPGTSEEYSNHGMGLCGLLIARTAGVPYETYIRDNVLLPIGLTNVVPTGIAPSLLDAAPHLYNGSGNPAVWNTLGVPHPAEYAAGGWSATARDLVRLMCATDKLANHSDILQPATINLMESRPYPNTAPSGAHGWRYEGPQGKLWHNGSVGGGASYIVKFPAGYTSANGTDLSNVNVAVCVNIQNANPLKGLVDTIAVTAGAASVPVWYDLFGGAYGG